MMQGAVSTFIEVPIQKEVKGVSHKGEKVDPSVAWESANTYSREKVSDMNTPSR